MSTVRAWKPIAAFLSICCGLALAAQAPAADFFFKPKDRIVFLGDSITEQYQYSSMIEYYLITRFPDWDLTIYNAGIGGDTAGGGLSRVNRDILCEKPTAVTINFGMNDGGYRPPDPGIYNNYIKNQDGLVKKLTDARVRVALLATSPVEARKRKDGEAYNETLANFCKGLKEVAGKHGAQHYDQFHPALKVLQRMAADNATFNCFPDSVHTNGEGGLLMAWSILTAMDAPAVVSDATLDSSGKVGASDRCKISTVNTEGGKLSFNRLDEALPLVLSAEQKKLLPYLDNLKALNYYGLKVTGLTGDQYELSIDGKSVAKLSRDNLAKGVNLANYNLGPITTQSQAVWNALSTRNALLHWRFRNIRMQSQGTPPGLMGEEAKEFAELRDKQLAIVDKSLEEQRVKIYKLDQPKAHEFELRPAK